MMVMHSYTKACLDALAWFDDHQPVGLFDRTAPHKAMRQSLERRGLIEVAGPKQNFQIVKYRLSKDGQRALRESKQ